MQQPAQRRRRRLHYFRRTEHIKVLATVRVGYVVCVSGCECVRRGKARVSNVKTHTKTVVCSNSGNGMLTYASYTHVQN